MTDLRLFDLNLLVAFDALMVERNVTRAARRIHIGQPAMSYALSRLRELFGDELFIRTSASMQPTNRALELAGPISRILTAIRTDVLADRAFRPELAENLFRIAATDYAETVLLPGVLAVLQQAAPRARVAITSVGRERVATMLESGVIDLAIGYFPDRSEALRAEELFNDSFVCLFDADACHVTVPLTSEAYMELPHIVTALRGEAASHAEGPPPRAHGAVFMTTPHVLTIPFLLHGFRAVATVPRRLAEHCAELAALTISAPPAVMESFDVSMHWHARTETDPAQRWFRALMRDVGRAK